jgi:hypothetical protein
MSTSWSTFYIFEGFFMLYEHFMEHFSPFKSPFMLYEHFFHRTKHFFEKCMTALWYFAILPPFPYLKKTKNPNTIGARDFWE